MKDNTKHNENLSGSLLVAHPTLLDPNFNKSVILLSAHTEETGAFGVVINRPAGKTLGDLDDHFASSPLADVVIYQGGPVSPDQMILSAWKCNDDSGIFKLHFGITEEKAKELIENEPGTEVRGFLGYAGWTEGQLEGEIQQNAWMVLPVNTGFIDGQNGPAMWRLIINDINPELGLMADVPDDPSLN